MPKSKWTLFLCPATSIFFRPTANFHLTRISAEAPHPPHPRLAWYYSR
jgi:hypothetical protein